MWGSNSKRAIGDNTANIIKVFLLIIKLKQEVKSLSQSKHKEKHSETLKQVKSHSKIHSSPQSRRKEPQAHSSCCKENGTP